MSEIEKGENSLRFTVRWLQLLSGLVALLGVAMAVIGDTLFFAPFNALFDVYFWGDNPIPEEAQKFRAWWNGVLGGIMVGWCILLIFILQYPYARKEKWGWNAIAVSLAFWYLLDTGASYWWGVTINVISNSIILAAFVIPLFVTRRYFTD